MNSTERSVVRLSGERAEKRVAHWQGVVVAACEQSGRNHVPEVSPIHLLLDWLGVDCGKLAIYTIQKRMLNLLKEVGRKCSQRLVDQRGFPENR
ncbi:MAG: 16S rRNA (uracil(1498)-N(3))-methyltransferase [Sulfuricella sp.]